MDLIKTERMEWGSARILAPVDKVEEVEALVRAGAHELYGGVQPNEWRARSLSANQRSFASAQFPSEEAFAEAASEARRLSVPLHLALNAPLYDPIAYGPLLALAERAARWGAAGVIAADLGLLARLAEAALPFGVTLSTMAGAMNRSALQLFKRFGIRRVVLPRHLTLGEMASVVSAHPDLAFEAFVLVGRCPNEEAYCTFQHTNPAKRWPCEIPYALSDTAGNPLPVDHPLARWWEEWNRADRRMACGLCGLSELARIGVSYLKIVGRGAATASKVKDVQWIAEFTGRNPPNFAAREAYAERFGRPCHRLTCYFPELYPSG